MPDKKKSELQSRDAANPLASFGAGSEPHGDTAVDYSQLDMERNAASWLALGENFALKKSLATVNLHRLNAFGK